LTDDILQEKGGSIERCVVRVRAKYEGHEAELENDIDLQDIIVLNLQRACQTAIDMGMRMGRLRRLGLPKDSADIFAILQTAGLLTKELTCSLHRMVGFRNIAVHEYRKLDLAKVRYIIEHRLDDLLAFSKAMLLADPTPEGR
jgi:uncharacterized protein YutE (UPF0331/DUF86 family)